MNFEHPLNRVSKTPEKAEIDKNLFLEEQKEENSEKETEGMKNKIKISYGGREYELENTTYEFEYPDRIIKETGILGYKRTVISREEILKLAKSYMYDNGVNVKDCKDFESINEVLNKKRMEKQKEFGFIPDRMFYEQKYEVQKKYNDYAATKEGGIVNSYKKPNSFFNLFDLSLSNGEFPYRTMNHYMGAYCGDKQAQITMTDNFIKNRFFLQKIFDFNLSKEVKLGERTRTVDSTEDIIFDIYKKGSDIKITEISSHHLNKYEKEIKNNEIYLIGNDAFNTVASNFWYSASQNISVGFTLNDKLFNDYIKKAYEIFLKNNFNTSREIIGIEQIIRMLAFCNDNFYKEYQDFFHDYDDLERTKRKIINNRDISNISTYLNADSEFNMKENVLKERKEKLNKDFVKLVADFLPNINLEENISSKEIQKFYYGDSISNINKVFLSKLKNILEKEIDLDSDNNNGRFSYTNHMFNFLEISAKHLSDGEKDSEVCIPIFINHDEIPQICWGHAKYAHFYNQKGFNFFEFKHAEELPKQFSVDDHGI